MKLRESPLAVRREQGFTLIELMVAVAAFSVVSLAAFAVLQSGQRNALMNDQTVKVQQNVRLAMDLIARDIRLTGYGNPNPLVTPLPGCASHMVPTNAAAGSGLSDTIAIMTVNQEVGQLSAPIPAVVATDMPMKAGLIPPVPPGVVTLEGIFTSGVTLTNPVLLKLVTTLPTTANFQAGTRVFDLACVTYTVTGPLATPPFQLMRAIGANLPVAIVDGIESLQLAYAVDTTGTGVITGQPGGTAGTFGCLDFVPNNGPCTDFVAGVAVVHPAGTGTVTLIPATVNQTPTAVRQVRITVVGRAIPPANYYFPNNCWRDPTFTGSAVIIAEDQVLTNATASVPAACGLPPGGIRRRALTRVVSLRETNLN